MLVSEFLVLIHNFPELSFLRKCSESIVIVLRLAYTSNYRTLTKYRHVWSNCNDGWAAAMIDRCSCKVANLWPLLFFSHLTPSGLSPFWIWQLQGVWFSVIIACYLCRSWFANHWNHILKTWSNTQSVVDHNHFNRGIRGAWLSPLVWKVEMLFAGSCAVRLKDTLFLFTVKVII